MNGRTLEIILSGTWAMVRTLDFGLIGGLQIANLLVLTTIEMWMLMNLISLLVTLSSLRENEMLLFLRIYLLRLALN